MTRPLGLRLLFCAIASALASAAYAQNAATPDTATPASPDQAKQRVNPSSTSNTTTQNDTRRASEQLETIEVSAKSLSLGGGLMSVQTAPKAVSTITREAIVKAAPGSNFTQMISSIPGVNASTDDVTGLSDGNYTIRGFAASEVGTTVNGAPINDSGSYAVFATEYGDTENYGDITVEQGIPDVDQPDSGAAGGHIAWATIDPSHDAGIDFTQSFGSHNYDRTFLRLNTGDTGPVRSWISYSWNSVDKWRGAGDLNVWKVDGKSIWTIDDNNSISASLQYNHEDRDNYLFVTKSQVAQKGYYYDYDTTYAPGSLDTNFYKLHTNPFKDYLFSLDGEFRLTNTTHLSVIPYFQYGDGGGGTGNKFFAESNTTQNQYENANQDLNQDGAIVTGPNGTKSIAYGFSHSTTYRPGMIAKIIQDLGPNDSLEYGFWYERPRQEQSQTFGLANYETGVPFDVHGNDDLILYPDGTPQRAYAEYTETKTEKVFITDTWTPSDQWLFSLGAAYLHVTRDGYDFEDPGSTGGFATQIGSDNISASYDKVTPALGIKYSPDDKNQFYYGIGKTFRAPPNVAIALNVVTDRLPNIPESAVNNDFGWRYYGDTFSTNVMLYRSYFHNRTITGFDDNTGQTFYTQIDRMKMQGLNAEASWNLAQNWKLYGSYTYTQATVESNIDAGDDGIYPTIGKQLFNTPRNIAYVALNYDNGPAWASLNARYRSSVYGDYMNTEQVGGYTSLGLDMGYRFSDWGTWLKKPFIKFNIFNLADHRAFANANNAGAYLAANPGGAIKGVDGSSLFTSAPTYTLLEPRTFMVTIGGSLF